MNSSDMTRLALAGMSKDNSWDDLAAVVITLAVLLVCVALPIVLKHRAKSQAMVAAADQPGMQALWDTARRMETRIGYLEAVLDTEVPGWRSRSDTR